MKFMAVPVLKIYPGGKLRTDDWNKGHFESARSCG
jgi:hypothetical protein